MLRHSDDLAKSDPTTEDLFTDAAVTFRGLPEEAEFHEFMADVLRNEAAITEAELAEMERRSMHIDLAQCEFGAGRHWCPRCGFGCCTVTRDPEDRDRLVCSGGCDRFGHHHCDPENLLPALENSVRREMAKREAV